MFWGFLDSRPSKDSTKILIGFTESTDTLVQWKYGHFLLDLPTSEVSPAPEFREMSRIREFPGKRPKKLPNATKTLKRLPKIAQNFYIFVKSTQKSSQFFLEIAENFSVFVTNTQKSSRKAPEFWRDFNLATSLAHSGQPTKWWPDRGLHPHA